MSDGYFVTPADAPQVEMFQGLHRRTMGTTDEVMLCEFFVERGTEVTPHSHLNDQVGYLVYGQLDYTIGGERRLMQQGDSWAIPGGVLHSAVAVQNSLIVEVFSPPREDYRTEAR
jgi:quercetin dioxygenase-like cupin family protein